MPNRYFKKSDRKDQVELALKIRGDNGKSPEGSAYVIAKLIDMAVSPNLFSILADMVAERRLNVRVESLGARGERKIYTLANYQTQSEEDRVINLKINGKIYQERLL